ncbi:ribosome biogenesis GTPase YlqF [Aerococcaceae bacterium WGS1372]
MSSNVIQWFPGHMAKARREATEKMHLVDVVIELVDARIPESSRNPMIDDIVGNKPRIIALNKSDLANPALTQQWIESYESQGIPAVAIDSQHNKGLRGLQQRIQVLMVPYFEKQKERGVKPRSIRLMILGIPNVGKSTLINRFVGKNQAQTGNKPGVTKAQRWLKINNQFDLLDTPGILWPKFEDPNVGTKLGITGAIKDSLLYMDDLAIYLLSLLQEISAETIKDKYGVTMDVVLDSTSVDLLLEITKKMGLKDNFDEASQRIIMDYRKGNLGQITLDRVVDTKNVKTND